jgi:uncharacterized protein (TIGR03066 family)
MLLRDSEGLTDRKLLKDRINARDEGRREAGSNQEDRVMNRLFSIALAGLLIGLAGLASADDKDDNAKNIVGKWEATKSGSGLLIGSWIDFTNDGKISGMIKGDDWKQEGTYKVVKDKLTVKFKNQDPIIDVTVTITKLTADALEYKFEDGNVDVFKKTK